MKKKEISHIKEDIPITGYDEESGCILYGDGSCMNMLQVYSKDLINSDADEIEMDCFKWAKFYKIYGKDVEIISLMFPCDTKTPQQYWKKKLKHNLNPEFRDMIERKIQELEWREKHTATKEFYLVLFFDSKTEVKEAMKLVENTLGTGSLGLVREMDREKKELILFKLANKNSLIF